MEELSLDEITSWRTFENLVADYFREVKNDKEFNVEHVEIKESGIGKDSGRDILVKLTLNDAIVSFKRIWVIQCKFHKGNIGKAQIADVNIPTLVHEYAANGYLLVCKADVTSGLTESFEELNKKCKFGYKYICWSGESFLRRIQFKNVAKKYFPKYADFLAKKELFVKDTQ